MLIDKNLTSLYKSIHYKNIIITKIL
uniref:Uncharacterized protein n=1 Tax=Lepeophtheirus salmonis TaxID=72036 RepID=A0A0K2UR04_LEPSM